MNSGEWNSEDVVDPAEAWLTLARRLTKKINLAAWLAGFSPMFSISTIISAGVSTGWRKLGWDPSGIWFSYSVFCLGAAVYCGYRVQCSSFSIDKALARLEFVYGLHNRLSAANNGVCKWPPFPRFREDGLSWSWLKAFAPGAAACVILFLSLKVPAVPVFSDSGVQARSEPPVWSEIEKDIQNLRSCGLIEEQGLNGFEAKLTSLREKPDNKWYDHASLEASDSLQKQLESEINALDRTLGEAENTLGALLDEKMDAQSRQELMSRLNAALSDALRNEISLDRKHLQNLGVGASGAAPQLSKDDLRKLLSDLSSAKRALESISPGAGKEKNGNGEKGNVEKNNGRPESGSGLPFSGSSAKGAASSSSSGGGGMGALGMTLGPANGNSAGSMRIASSVGNGGDGRGTAGQSSAGIAVFTRNPPLPLSEEGKENIFDNTQKGGEKGRAVGRAKFEPMLSHSNENFDESSALGGAAQQRDGGARALRRSEFTPEEISVLKRYFK